jgi:hypothetical protein
MGGEQAAAGIHRDAGLTISGELLEHHVVESHDIELSAFEARHPRFKPLPGYRSPCEAT